MGELSIWNGLSAELDIRGVGAGFLGSVGNVDGAISIVNDFNVDVIVGLAVNATGDLSFSSLGGIQLNDAFLSNGNILLHVFCIEESKKCTVVVVVVVIVVYIRLLSKTTVIKLQLVNRQITNQKQLLKRTKNRQCGYIRDL